MSWLIISYHVVQLSGGSISAWPSPRVLAETDNTLSVSGASDEEVWYDTFFQRLSQRESTNKEICICLHIKKTHLKRAKGVS